MMFESILITGCGGDIAIGLCRILKMTKSVRQIIGCDIHDDHLGILLFDTCEISLRADHKDYFISIQKIIEKYSVDLIVPMSEAEIGRFVNSGFTHAFENVPVILANEKTVRIGMDKLQTVSFLKENGIVYPWTIVARDAPPYQIPCILKSRYGQGSKNFIKIIDHESVKYYEQRHPNDIWQELLLPDEQEYTCCVYRTCFDEIRTIAIQRKLQGGLTSTGIIVHNEQILQYLYHIAESLNLRGSINVQLRLTNQGPVAFEINPRFSSTVVFRHLLGFQDFIWSLKEIKGLQLDPFEDVRPGLKFYRGSREYIMEGPI